MLFDEDELIVSIYVTESVNQLIAGHFGHVGQSVLYAADECLQYVAETSCNQVSMYYVSARDQFIFIAK